MASVSFAAGQISSKVNIIIFVKYMNMKFYCATNTVASYRKQIE